jgi:hypothetical protein
MNNLGILTFIGVVSAIVVPIFVTGLDAHSVQNGMSIVGRTLMYHFPVYVYQVILLTAAGTFYYYRLKNKYRIQGISQKILVGVWKNNWGPPQAGHEILKITPDMKYYIGDDHYFNIIDFKYDPQTNYIEFKKVGVKPNDHREVLNKVRIVNNDMLEGTEQDYPIKYTKLTEVDTNQ